MMTIALFVMTCLASSSENEFKQGGGARRLLLPRVLSWMAVGSFLSTGHGVQAADEDPVRYCEDDFIHAANEAVRTHCSAIRRKTV